MLCTIGLVLSMAVTSAFAAPTKQVNLDDVQCRCLTFSTSAAPTHCVYQELLTLDWSAAHSLALANDLKIQFASEKTISKVLSIPKPLPATVLEAVQQGETLPLDPSKKVRSENRLICGFGNDLDQVESYGAGLKPEIHYVGTVLGLFMLLFIIYLVADYIWTVYVACTPNPTIFHQTFVQANNSANRHAARPQRIKLEGDEKALTAEYDSSTAPPANHR
jgi:hypothetical protein